MGRVGLVKTTSLDTRIDDLYRAPLDEFVAARSQLAKELKGDDARQVKQLKKPTTVPWAVNQVYWHARPLFDRVLKSGADVRKAQVAALEGRKGDVRAASAAHREAIAAAVGKATELAGAKGVQPARDELTQTFEALSLAAGPPDAPGRLTQSLRPGGFEMLAGVEPAAKVSVPRPPAHARPGRNAPESSPPARSAPPQKPDRAAERRAAEAARRREAAIRNAETAVARARDKEAHARAALETASRERHEAEQQLAAAKNAK